MGKKILRLTENEMVDLLERIANKIKETEKLEENEKESKKQKLREHLEKISLERKNKNEKK